MGIETILKELIGNHPIFRVLDQQQFVWKAIDEGMEKYPEHAHQIYEMMGWIGNESLDFDDVLPIFWERHVEELIERLGNGCNKNELQLGTSAQVVLGCMHSSIRYPLDSVGTGFYEWLFRDFLGDDIYLELYADHPHKQERLKDIEEAKGMIGEQWPGQFEELLAGFKRDLRKIHTRPFYTKKDLENKHKEDIERGNTNVPYMKYVGTVQLDLL